MNTADLTRTPINELPAGAFIDRLVQRDVMGWKTAPADNGKDIGLFTKPDGEREWGFCFLPSLRIDHAWQVAERLRTLGHYVNVNVRREVVWCRIENYDGDELWAVKTETAPLAICRAALMAVSMPPPGWKG